MSHPRRLALLGGGFSTDEDGLLDDWVLGRAPTVSRVPGASVYRVTGGAGEAEERALPCRVLSRGTGTGAADRRP